MRVCDEASTTRIRTADVPEAERVEYWESYNARALVGLRCSSFANAGLRAEAANTDLGGLRVAEIAGNEHVIERTSRHVHELPSDATFLSIIVRGDAFFYHGSGCVPLGPGEALAYDPAKPYLFGFSGPMQKILLDLPANGFRRRCLPAGLAEPVRLGHSRRQRNLLSAIRGELSGKSDRIHASELAERTWSLLAGLFGESDAETHVLLANAYLESCLADERLTPARVADAVGVSLRHLNRLFAQTGHSLAETIRERRLERAFAELRAARTGSSTVLEIAHRCGFTSQAHFTRVFKHRFGNTPGEVLSEASARSWPDCVPDSSPDPAPDARSASARHR